MRTATSFILGASAAILSTVVPAVRAHGQVHSVSSPSGGSNVGPNIYYAADAKNKNTAVRTMYTASGKAFADPGDYSNPSVMSCEGASGAPATIDINAGEELSIRWEGSTNELMGLAGLTEYPPYVHAMGPILDYIADCNGKCSTFDATNADWVKIAQAGLDTSAGVSDDLRNKMAAKPEPYNGKGRWAMAQMLEQYSTWNVKIPSALKPGQYIVRNELVAVHSPNAFQHYIACVQVNVKGSGTSALPAGVKSSSLYQANSAFAKYNVYNTPGSFELPSSPAVWNPSASNADPAPATTTKAAETTQAAQSTNAAPTTTKAAEPITTKAAATTTNGAAAATSPAGSSAAAAPTTTKKCSAKKRAAKRAAKEAAAAKAAAEAAAKRSVREARAARAAHRRASHMH